MIAPDRDARDQPILAAVAIFATLLMAPVLSLAGGYRLVTILGVLLAAVLVAAGRDTRPALFALLLVGLLWLTTDADPRTPWSLVLAVLMLTTHGAVALRSSLPPGASLDWNITLRWLFRAGVTFGLTVLVYLAVLGAHYVRPGDGELMLALALGLLAGLVLLLRRETMRQPSP